MPLAIFIGLNEDDANAFKESKGKIVVHGDSVYLLREVHEFTSASLADRNSEKMERRVVAELRPCVPDETKGNVSAPVKKRIDFAFDANEFTMKQL